MHELSVCLSLLQQVETIAHENNARSVDRIVLRIGPLSGVEADLLRNAYPLAVAGSIAENAELVIEDSGVIVQCTECDTESSVPSNRLVCPECGDYRTRLVSGDEMILQRLEFSTDG